MKKKVSLALVAAVVSTAGSMVHADVLRLRVTGSVTDVDLAARTFTVGSTRLTLGSRAILPLVGSQIRAVGLTARDGTILVDQYFSVASPNPERVDVQRLPRVESDELDLTRSAVAEQVHNAGAREQSVTGSGVQSVTGSGIQSVTGSGVQSVTGSGIQSVTGSGIQSVTGSGKR